MFIFIVGFTEICQKSGKEYSIGPKLETFDRCMVPSTIYPILVFPLGPAVLCFVGLVMREMGMLLIYQYEDNPEIESYGLFFLSALCLSYGNI